MFFDQTNQELHRMDDTENSNAFDTPYVQSYLRGFRSTENSLAKTLELLQSYRAVLEADVNFAQLFNVPLSSSVKAEGVEHLFRHKLHVLETNQAGCIILWTDVVRSTTYEPTQKSNGSYHIQVDKGKVSVSKEDHDFIATGLPRQLVNPHSYPCDVASEIEIVEFTRSQIVRWKDLSLQLAEATENVFTGLSEKIEQLQRKYKAFRPQLNPADGYTQDSLKRMITPEITDRLPKNKPGKKANGNNSWTVQEDNNLPSWFEQHRNLPQKQIASQYLAFSGKERTFYSLQSRLYKLGFGYLCNKKTKPSHEMHAASVSQSLESAQSLPVARRSLGSPQLSVAMENIVRSASLPTQKSSGTQTMGTECAPDMVPWQAPRTGRSPEDIGDSGLGLDFLVSDGIRHKSVGQNSVASSSTTKNPLDQNTVSLAALPAPRLSKSEPIADRSFFQSTDELQETLPGRADCSILTSESTIASNMNEPATEMTTDKNREVESSTDPQLANARENPSTANGPKISQPASKWLHCRDINNAGGEADPSTMIEGTAADGGLNGHTPEQIPYPNIPTLLPAGFIAADIRCHNRSAPNRAPIIPPKPRKKRAPYRRTKTGCITCRRRRKKCDEQKPSCRNCMRSGHMCEGYQKPEDPRLPVARATPRLLRPLERDTSVSFPDATENNTIREEYLNTTSSDPLPFRSELPQSSSTACLSENQDICGEPPSASSAVPHNQHLTHMHPSLPPGHPMPQKRTIPSIRDILQDTLPMSYDS